MKTLLKLLCVLICTSQTSCIVLSSGNGSYSPQAEMLIKCWNLQHVYRSTVGQQFDYRSCDSSCWIQFYTDGKCYENGLLGTGGKQQLRWVLKGNELRIKGKKLTYADGNLSGNSVEYTIVNISDNELHLSRWDGQLQNGTAVYRHVIFK